MRKILLEICAGSVEDAVEAQAGGAQRIELNASLFEGGLTPSLGTLIEARARTTIPLICMLRPRCGGFCYSRHEFAAMERDAELMLAHGADGLAFGCLREDGALDRKRTARLVKLANKRETVFHRAFDVTRKPLVVMEQLIDLGLKRILTSGQEANASDGCGLIRKLVEKANGRIQILPGGGINRFNLADILERTGVTQVHLSARMRQTDRSTQARPQVSFGGALRAREDQYFVTDRAAVAAIRALLKP